jgi:hypothetical protein
MNELSEKFRTLEIDPEPHGWPPVWMRDISSLCAEITRLNAKLEGAKDENMLLLHTLGDKADEITRLRFELEGVHSCGPTCTRDACVNRRLRDALPNLQYVIDWLSNGCDVSEAVKELRIHQAQIEKIRSE